MRRLTKAVMTMVCTVALAGALTTAPAAASGFTAGSYPATLSGKSIGNPTVTTSLGKIACAPMELAGVVSEPSPAYSAGVDASTCSIFGTAPVDMHGCGLTFHPGSGEGYVGTVDIGPAECGPITIKGSYTTISIYPKTGLSSVSFKNVGSGSTAEVDVTAQLTGLKYTLSGSSTVYENGELSAHWLVRADDEAGNQVEVSTVGELPDGLFAAGKGGEAGNLPRFDAEVFPAAIQAHKSQSHVISSPLGKITCSTADFTGSASEAASALSLHGGYGSCTSFGLAATVKMNSCDYVANIANSGPPYSGVLNLVCSTKGDGIEISNVVCTLKFPAQEMGVVAYENLGEGYDRKIAASISGSGLTWTSTGGCGSGEATFSGGLLLAASY